MTRTQPNTFRSNSLKSMDKDLKMLPNIRPCLPSLASVTHFIYNVDAALERHTTLEYQSKFINLFL